MIERYTLPEMCRVWSEAHKYELWCSVEVMVLEAHAEAGTVPAGARITITVTGHGLKDPQWALRTADGSEILPVRVAPDVVSIADALELD